MKNLIFVVKHKRYKVPNVIPYKSISVGSNYKTFQADYHDNTGKNNIALKNDNYCELTAQYWIYKNISNQYDNIGLNHYRRYFANSKFERFTLLKNEKIDDYLKKYDIILPNPWRWNISVAENYYIVGCGKKKDLMTTRNVIKKYYPDYLESFDCVLNSKEASYCNMLVTSRNLFNKYNKWLFTVLEHVEQNTDLSNYTPAEARIYGYLSELLLNVWVSKNQLKVKYLPMIKKDNSFKDLIKSKVKFFSKGRI